MENLQQCATEVRNTLEYTSNCQQCAAHVVRREGLDQVRRLLRQDGGLVAVAVLVDREHAAAVRHEAHLLHLCSARGRGSVDYRKTSMLFTKIQ